MDSPPSPRVDQLITMALEVAFYCIHLSVIIVMIAYRKTVFNSAFYYMLLTICIADLLYFIFVTLLAMRFPGFGFFMEFYLNNMWIASATFTLSNVLGYGQFLGQTLISMNRFTVFWLPAKHDRIWKRKWYLFVLIILPLFVIPTRIPDGGKIVFSKSGAAVTYASEAMENRALYMTSVVYVVNGSITATLSLLTVFKYWRLRLSGDVLPVPQLEARMLTFSIVVFFIQLLRVAYVYLRNLFLPFPSIIAVLMYLLPFISDLHAWVCSISLIFMSQDSRRAYFTFYFGSIMKPKRSILVSVTPVRQGRMTSGSLFFRSLPPISLKK